MYQLCVSKLKNVLNFLDCRMTHVHSVRRPGQGEERQRRSGDEAHLCVHPLLVSDLDDRLHG